MHACGIFTSRRIRFTNCPTDKEWPPRAKETPIGTSTTEYDWDSSIHQTIHQKGSRYVRIMGLCQQCSNSVPMCARKVWSSMNKKYPLIDRSTSLLILGLQPLHWFYPNSSLEVVKVGVRQVQTQAPLQRVSSVQRRTQPSTRPASRELWRHISTVPVAPVGHFTLVPWNSWTCWTVSIVTNSYNSYNSQEITHD